LAEDLGLLWMERREFDRAEGALLEAYRLRRLHRLRDVEPVLIALSRLALQRGQARAGGVAGRLARQFATDSPRTRRRGKSAFALAQSIAAAGRSRKPASGTAKRSTLPRRGGRKSYRRRRSIIGRHRPVPGGERVRLTWLPELGARRGQQGAHVERPFSAVEQKRTERGAVGAVASELAEDAEYVKRWCDALAGVLDGWERPKPGKAAPAAASWALQRTET